MNVRVRLQRKLSTEELMLLNCGVGEDFESLLDYKIKSINSSVLSFLCSLTLTSIHDYCTCMYNSAYTNCLFVNTDNFFV